MAVTSAHIATTLLRPPPALDSLEAQAWEMWIEDARNQITQRFGDIYSLDQATVDYVVREAVALKIKRPDPVLKIDVSVDDGGVSKTYEKGSGQVLILDEWWTMLTPRQDRTSRGAFTITPGRRGPR